jgi:hypothetical protein
LAGTPRPSRHPARNRACDAPKIRDRHNPGLTRFTRRAAARDAPHIRQRARGRHVRAACPRPCARRGGAEARARAAAAVSAKSRFRGWGAARRCAFGASGSSR